jgi:hypothetical protein
MVEEPILMGPRVVLESPLRATDVYTREQHRRYLLAGIHDSFKRGEAPYCSHFYADVLDDDNPQERHAGISAGLLWAAQCKYAVFLRDLGISEGMREAMEYYNQLNIRWEYRSLEKHVVKMIREMGEQPDPQDMTDFS